MSRDRKRWLIRLIAFAVAAVVWYLQFGLRSQSLWADKDSMSYWAAGKLLLHRSNPYDFVSVRQVEQAAGSLLSSPLMMRNPPWALPLALPLGIFPLGWAGFIWVLGIFACVRASIHLIRPMLGASGPGMSGPGTSGRLHLLMYFFPAVLACIITGQSSAIPLVGLCLFLSLQNRRPFLAGLGLSLCTVKPHLFIAFACVMAAWIISRKAWSILAGTLAGIGLALSIVFLFDPHIVLDYLAMLRSSGIEGEVIPAASALPRFLGWLILRRDLPWLSLLAMPIGISWGMWYYRVHVKDWDWLTHGSLLMIVSLLTAPYVWVYDEVVLLPAILTAMYRVRERGNSLRWVIAAMVFADLEMLLVRPLPFLLCMWTLPFWFGWYLWATRSVRPGSPEVCAVSPARDAKRPLSIDAHPIEARPVEE